MDQARVQGIAQTVPEQVKSQHGDHDGKAGEEDEVGRAKDLVALAGQHSAPLGRGRLSAQTDEGERGRVQDGGGNTEGSLDDEGGKGVR